jgi:2-polyprenyl-3-methyl-5-hydroxy-6-metoxy-1,4-benzoquinol methylase
MAIKFARKKGRNLLLSVIYKCDKILPFSKIGKLRFYLDLEWIFDRLAHEQSYKVFGKENHPIRHLSAKFLLDHLEANHEVMDLGCNSGELTFLLSKKVRSVTGVDHNEKLIHEAKRKYADFGISFVGEDAVSYLEKNKKKFDVLVLSHMIEHLDNPALLLQQCKKFFSYVYIEVPDLDRSHLNVYRTKVSSKLMYSDADHIWEFGRNDVQKLIIESDLVILDMEFMFGAQKYWCRVA